MSSQQSYIQDLVQKPGYKGFPKKEVAFKKRLEVLKKKAFSYRRKKWQKLEENNGCSVHSIYFNDSGYTAVRGRKAIKSQLQPREFIDFAHRVTLDTKWDDKQKKLEPKYVYYNSIFSFGKRMCDLIHFRYNSGKAFISDRDFVILRQRVHDPEKNISYMFGGSVDTTEEPEIYPKGRKCVRGEVFIFMWTVVKPNPDTLVIEYLTHSTPGGLIPKGLFNRTVKEKALCVNRYSEDFIDYSKKMQKEIMEARKRRLEILSEERRKQTFDNQQLEEEAEAEIRQVNKAKTRKQILEKKLLEEKSTRDDEKRAYESDLKQNIAKEKLALTGLRSQGKTKEAEIRLKSYRREVSGGKTRFQQLDLERMNKIERMEARIKQLDEIIAKSEDEIRKKQEEAKLQQEKQQQIMEEEEEERKQPLDAAEWESQPKFDDSIGKIEVEEEEMEGEADGEEKKEEVEEEGEGWLGGLSSQQKSIVKGAGVLIAVGIGITLTVSISKYFAKRN